MKTSTKIFLYIVGILIIFVAIFLGIKMGRIYFDKSANYGSGFVNSWTGKTETFSYKQTGLALSKDDATGTYVAQIQTGRVEDFDGVKNGYEILINEINCYNATYGAGNIVSKLHKQFLDPDGQVIADSTLTVRVNFLIDKTTISITCNDGEAAANCWDSFFKNFGFRLKLVKIGG